MFKITALEDEARRKNACEKCGISCRDGELAYAAVDVSLPNEPIIAVCTFTLTGGKNSFIRVGTTDPEDEAVLILIYTVLDFLRRVGFSAVTADATVKNYAERLGFGCAENDLFVYDLSAPHGCAERRGGLS